ncbi:hypothetical protein San01_32030 [Streptomyces angustmyceticus]|uniref:Uncharacterized protein n=1 Tax=Streptomyces angustmyceticus TaxID=285578 RepID=A0A5J4LGU1_9ACTN|nr:hypothetical protein San01_32030 [Streptomyces angustmyceticus]
MVSTGRSALPRPLPLSPFGGGGGGWVRGWGAAPRLVSPGPAPPRLARPRPVSSWTGKTTVIVPVLNHGRERACIRPWEAAKCDRKINCQWVRLRSEAWVTQTCANSRTR